MKNTCRGFRRADACVALFAAVVLSGCSKSGPDELVMRDGAVQSGQLAGCDRVNCTLDDTRYPRANIRWIGLRTGAADPPDVRDPEDDELHLASTSIVSAALQSIDEHVVRTDKASYERAQVAFVYLAPSSAPASPSLPSGASPPGGPAAASSNEPPGSYREIAACPADKPLGGWIAFVFKYDMGYCKGDGHFRIRFRLVPCHDQPVTAASGVGICYEAADLRYEMDRSECKSTERVHNPGTYCYMPPKTFPWIQIPTVVEGRPQLIFRPLNPILGWSFWREGLPPELKTDRFAPVADTRCVDGSNPEFANQPPGLPDGGLIEGMKQSLETEDEKAKECAGYSVPLGACGAWNSSSPKDCLSHPEKYAIIPFSGAQSHPMCETFNAKDFSVKWEVACGASAHDTPVNIPPSPVRKEY